MMVFDELIMGYNRRLIYKNEVIFWPHSYQPTSHVENELAAQPQTGKPYGKWVEKLSKSIRGDFF